MIKRLFTTLSPFPSLFYNKSIPRGDIFNRIKTCWLLNFYAQSLLNTKKEVLDVPSSSFAHYANRTSKVSVAKNLVCIMEKFCTCPTWANIQSSIKDFQLNHGIKRTANFHVKQPANENCHLRFFHKIGKNCLYLQLQTFPLCTYHSSSLTIDHSIGQAKKREICCYVDDKPTIETFNCSFT